MWWWLFNANTVKKTIFVVVLYKGLTSSTSAILICFHQMQWTISVAFWVCRFFFGKRPTVVEQRHQSPTIAFNLIFSCSVTMVAAVGAGGFRVVTIVAANSNVTRRDLLSGSSSHSTRKTGNEAAPAATMPQLIRCRPRGHKFAAIGKHEIWNISHYGRLCVRNVCMALQMISTY